MTTEQIVVSIVEDSNGTNKLIASTEKLASASDKLADSTDKARGATDKLSGSAGNAAKAVGGAAGSYNSLASAVGNVKSAFGGFTPLLASVGTYLSGEKIIKYADTYTEIGNRLKLVTKDQNATNRAMEESFTIAQQTRGGYEAVAGVYGRVNEALKNVNGTSATAASITKTVAEAVALSGASADAAKNALTQFQQGLASGTLRGDEFNSVMENTPGLARALSEGLGIPIGRLRSLAENGELTASRIVTALDKAAPKVAAAFAQSTPTVSQAFTVIENAAMRWIGQANNAYGATGMLANGMIFLANNMNIVAPALATLVAGLGLIATVSVASTIFGMVSSLVALAGAAGAAAIAIGTTFLIPIAAVAAAVGVAVLALNALGIKFKDITGFLGEVIAKITGYESFAKLATDATDKWKVANDFLNKSFGDQAGGAGKAGNAANDYANVVKKLNANVNSFGEDLDKTNKAVNDNTRASDNGSAAISRYVGATVNGTGAVKNYGEALGTASRSMDDFTASTNEGFAALQRFVTANQGIGPTIELLERYGNVGQGAFNKVANAADNAAASIARANQAGSGGGSGSGSVFGSNSVNAQIADYQSNYSSMGGGTPLQLDWDVKRNGETLTSFRSIFEIGPRGFSYNTNLADEAAASAQKFVDTVDKVRPGMTNAQMLEFMRVSNSGKGTRLEDWLTIWAQEDAVKARKANATSTSSNGSFTGGTQSGSSRPYTPTPQPQPQEPVRTVQTGGNSQVINVNIAAKDADTFGRSKNQMLQDFAMELARAG